MKLHDPRTWFKREEKASEAGTVISGMGAGSPVWSKRDYEQFAKEGYIRNAIDYRCIVMTAQAVSSVPLLLFKGDKLIDNSELLDLLNSPAPGQTLPFMLEAMATYLQIAGNGYFEGVGPDRKNAPPKEIWTLRPDRMKVIAGNHGLPSGYEYSANGKSKRWPVDPITGESKICHIKRFHPTNDWYGLSPTEPAAYAIDRHNEAGAHNMAVLQNGAVPSGMLVYKPIKKDGNETSAPPEFIEAAEKKLIDRHTGSGNHGRPMVTNGNVDWIQFAMTMEQLQLTETKLDAAQDICIVRGVPIDLLLPGQSTYNNKREAKLALYEETVLPLQKMIVDHLNIWLAPKFGDDLRLEPDLDAVEPLSLRREIRQKNTNELWTSGLISRDEARDALQFEPQPDMPQRKIDAGVLANLAKAAEADSSMMEPLWRYLKYVGLVGADNTFEEFLVGADDILQGLLGDVPEDRGDIDGADTEDNPEE